MQSSVWLFSSMVDTLTGDKLVRAWMWSHRPVMVLALRGWRRKRIRRPRLSLATWNKFEVSQRHVIPNLKQNRRKREGGGRGKGRKEGGREKEREGGGERRNMQRDRHRNEPCANQSTLCKLLFCCCGGKLGKKGLTGAYSSGRTHPPHHDEWRTSRGRVRI